MDISKTSIPDLLVIEPKYHGDGRGYFAETYNHRLFADMNIPDVFVQDNHARSETAGTLRGLHFQRPPAAQAKLVRVVRGSIFDVAVDLRPDSPTFGAFASVLLSEENRKQFFVPVGFAHGYCTLEDNTEVIYKVTDYYAPDHDGGIVWNDPALGIDWPLKAENIVLSEKDKVLPMLADCPKIDWTP
jgi:dTDP-4-dehydrorhamnose 3,5-epimerase